MKTVKVSPDSLTLAPHLVNSIAARPTNALGIPGAEAGPRSVNSKLQLLSWGVKKSGDDGNRRHDAVARRRSVATPRSCGDTAPRTPQYAWQRFSEFAMHRDHWQKFVVAPASGFGTEAQSAVNDASSGSFRAGPTLQAMKHPSGSPKITPAGSIRLHGKMAGVLVTACISSQSSPRKVTPRRFHQSPQPASRPASRTAAMRWQTGSFLRCLQCIFPHAGPAWR